MLASHKMKKYFVEKKGILHMFVLVVVYFIHFIDCEGKILCKQTILTRKNEYDLFYTEKGGETPYKM